MTRTPILEKVIKETIRRIEKKITQIEEIFNTSPEMDLYKLGYESTRKAEVLQGQKKFKEAAQVLEAAEKEKRRLLRIVKKKKDIRALCREQSNLELDLEALKWELIQIESHKKHITTNE